ncbi:MAG TPA: 2-deoxyribose-5-phosphate aldolase, partial [Cyanobacteria bacterium UBA11149]|nr:2-deoxyribose-5-phosphate aldolase [Cyanobacteria bacterium UBA11149]
IKASGGIRTIEQAFDLVIAGATRLGTSRGIDLLRQLENREEEN